jgi:hypothetical protein
VGLLAAFTIAEFVTLLVTLLLVYRQAEQPLSAALSRAALFFAWSGLILGWSAAFEQKAGLGAIALLAAATLILLFWLMRREAGTLREATALLARIRGRG